VVVDVPDVNDRAAVDRAVASRVNAVRRLRESALLREIEFLRRSGVLRRQEAGLGVPDIVILRQEGRLVLPAARTRSHDANNLSFAFPAAGAPGSWTAAQQAELQTIIDIVYPELKNVYGAPSWSGTVTILNGDALTPIISDRNALSGGAYDVTRREILFAQFNSIQTKVLSLTQMMAIAFRGPASISYDAWERGMARGATLVTVRSVLPLLEARFGAGSIDVADPLWHALDRYDLLNQPPLGTDRFFPPARENEPVDTGSLAGMLVPRLQMSGSAWLKVAAEKPTFFREFNDAYYHALATNPNLKNNVPGLRALAAGIAGTVEGLPFDDWYQRQHILDTSVTPGTKLYAWAFALRPEAAGDDDFALGVVLVYYRTVLAAGSADEVPLNGICYPIYWDYTFTSRLFLAAQYERVDIRDGLGTVAPTFFNTIGGDPALQGRMRITMDFPVNFESVRLQVAPRSSGKQPDPNNFWGAVVGADSGKLRIETETGVSAELDVAQGAFGGKLDPAAFSRPGRTTLTFTPTGGTARVRRVNTGYGEFIPVVYADDPVASLTHTFDPGFQMISFPLQPLRPKAAEALLNPATDLPLFNDGNLLLAQWRQNLNAADGDNYLRYPTMDELEPGKGYWSGFSAATAIKIRGRVFAQDQDVSVGLLNGWNQIATPYTQAVDISDLQFQYLADNVPQNLEGAIARGWIVAQNVPTVGPVAIWEFSPATGYARATRLEPWRGYWIRVLVSEGVTITYPNPSRAARRVPITRAALPGPVDGWAVPLAIRGPDGYGATAWLGQSPDAANGHDSKNDALRPPDFTRAVPAIWFDHPDWGAGAGAYYSDIRRIGARDAWEVTVYTPDPAKPYTLTWGNLARVPRSTRLVLVDTATNARRYLHTSSGYTFTPGSASVRKFRVLVEDRGRHALRIFNVAARPTRAGGPVQISYELSAGADVRADILAPTGRVVRRLSPGRAESAGVGGVLWDARDDRAVAVPAGSYLVRITARTPEGESATVVSPVLILR